MTKNSNFKEYVYPVIILTVIALVTTALLAVTNYISDPIIIANAEASANATRQELLPDADSFTKAELANEITSEDGKAEVKEVYTADNGSGTVATVVTKSFGGDLTMMVGMDADGSITGVSVTDHEDTPGVGTRDQDPEYLGQYKGMTALGSDNVKKETSQTESGEQFQYISGASVSGQAIHSGVQAALSAFADLKSNGGI
jgi:electron transport complex protein RnfG